MSKWRPCLFGFGTSMAWDSWQGETDGTTWNGFDNVRVKPTVHAAIVEKYGTKEDGVHQVPCIDGWHDYSNGYATKVTSMLHNDYDALIDAIEKLIRLKAPTHNLTYFVAEVIAVLYGAQDGAGAEDLWLLKEDQQPTIEDGENVRQILASFLVDAHISLP
jgi:hypothetical protein